MNSRLIGSAELTSITGASALASSTLGFSICMTVIKYFLKKGFRHSRKGLSKPCKVESSAFAKRSSWVWASFLILMS